MSVKRKKEKKKSMKFYSTYMAGQLLRTAVLACVCVYEHYLCPDLCALCFCAYVYVTVSAHLCVNIGMHTCLNFFFFNRI